jgi:hypothetical protein
VGITKVEATGNVFSLKKIEDFGGIYRAAAVDGTAVSRLMPRTPLAPP